MKTSVELLGDILVVLTRIENRLGSTTETPTEKKPAGTKTESTVVKLGAMGVLASLIGKKTVAGQLAEDIEKVKKAMTPTFIKNLTSSVNMLKEYVEISEKFSTIKTKKISGWAMVAQDISKALLMIAGGISAFALSMFLSGKVLGINPIGVLGYIMFSMIVLTASMILIGGGEFLIENLGEITNKLFPSLFLSKKIKSDKDRNSRAIQNAKSIGIALMNIAGGILLFSSAMTLAKLISGHKHVLGIVFEIVGTITLLSFSMLLLSGFTFAGELIPTLFGKKLPGRGEKTMTSQAIKNARDMGIALMIVAAGIISFSVSIMLVPKILKKADIGSAMLEILTIIGGMTLLITALGLLDKTKIITSGIIAAKGIGLSIAILSMGIIVIAAVSKLLLTMFKDSSGIEEKNKKIKGPFGNAITGLGIFGVFLAGLIGTLWLLGTPVISSFVLLGSIALIVTAIGLIKTTKAIKEVYNIMKEMGGEKGMKDMSNNIRLMVNGVLSGVISGIMGREDVSKLSDIDISRKEVQQFRRVKRIIKMLSSIATSLSKFAKGLSAYAKLGEVISLEYTFEKDEYGNEIAKPIIGKEGKIHVKSIAQTIADTFGIFIETLILKTDRLTIDKAKALKKFGRALTGDRGILSAIIDFSKVLQDFSKYGSAGIIYVPPVIDDAGNIKIKEENVPIEKITKNIASSFGKFVESLLKYESDFREGGKISNKMKKFSEALMGSEKGFLKRAKPGILTTIISFNDTLVTYAEYGSQGKLPLKDKDGNIIPGKFIKIEDIAKNLVNSMVMFTSAINTELGGKNIDNISKSIDKRIGSFTSIIDSFNKLADAEEGIDKLANSIGLLATNIGSLVTNMNNLDTTKLQTLATVTAQHAITTKGVSIEEKSVRTEKTSSSISQLDWEKIGEIIGNKVAEKVNLNNSTLDFYFHDWPRGKVELKTS